MAGVKKITDKRMATRLARKTRIRKRLFGTAERPRLSVFRSAKHIYVQAIDDQAHKVLAASSDVQKEIKGQGDGKKKAERARLVGTAIAAKLKEQNIASVVFDRNGFIYHGRVKEVAEGAREGGLQF